jgi:hypothetical protein
VLAYRIVPRLPPEEGHFRSFEAEGRIVPPDAPDEVRRKWPGVSAYGTVERAAHEVRSVARRARLGGYYALLELPDRVRVEVDPPSRFGSHLTILGETPSSLLGYVIDAGELPQPERGVQ